MFFSGRELQSLLHDLIVPLAEWAEWLFKRRELDISNGFLGVGHPDVGVPDNNRGRSVLRIHDHVEIAFDDGGVPCELHAQIVGRRNQSGKIGIHARKLHPWHRGLVIGQQGVVRKWVDIDDVDHGCHIH
jgi:hypothetical protein